MTGRSVGGAFGSSPLEVAAVAVTLGFTVGVGLLWGVGVVIGSILGATLPGASGEGVVAMLHSFPDVGSAWEPPIPSGLVWACTATLVAVFGPQLWRVARAGDLSDQGAEWATTMDLRRAGLLVPDQPLPQAQAEEPSDEA